ncbi:VWA domain-containing protein [Ideonella sp. YS5]|uniref:VWA domain-containing protein n=1 Tax=Ideonella sp. YS5 TaxID=3453714 RepID=UPI003EEDC6C0
MALQLNLEKSKAALQLCLHKAGVTQPPVMDMGVLLDVSGSFEDEHQDGTTNRLLTRLIPWGLTFDPDGKLDVTTFSHGERHVHRVGSVTAGNYTDFVQRQIIGRVPGWNGGTDYSWGIEDFLRLYGWIESTAKPVGLLGRLFGMKPEQGGAAVPGQRRRSLVTVVTDGDNNDKDRTRQVLRASQARQDEVYVLFLGVSNQDSRFPFLESVGDEFTNTGFVAIPDIRRFVGLADEELNELLLTDELVAWLKR